MKLSMILAWSFTGAALVIGLVLLLIFSSYQVDGTLAFGCSFGSQNACQQLQTDQIVHDLVGVVILFCVLAFIGCVIWAGIATHLYQQAEQQRRQLWAAWYAQRQPPVYP